MMAKQRTPTPEHDGLWIIGTGGHARVVLDLALACGFAIKGFIEPTNEPVTAPFTNGYSVLRGMDTLRDIESPAIAVAIGDNTHRRETSARAVAMGGRATTLIHPSALIEASAAIEPGAQVCIGAIVNAAARVGAGAIVNSGAIVEHECTVGAFTHVCPGVNLAGRVGVGDGAMIGLGASVIQGVTIGTDAVIGAGAVVLGDVPAGATVVGVPARAV